MQVQYLKIRSMMPSLQTTGSPQGTGFPLTSGQNSGTFGAALRGALSGLGNFFKTSTLNLKLVIS